MRPRLPGNPIILLTGFEPFLTLEHNPSADLAAAVAAAARHTFPDVTTVARVLPTEWSGGPRALCDHYAELQPHVAIHFGVSSKATGFEIETRGTNTVAQTEDASGRMPIAGEVCVDGPLAVTATLPSRLILARLRLLGLPARLSRDAGGYICNTILYTALTLPAGQYTPSRCGFVHLPSSLKMGRRAAGPGEPTALTRQSAIAGGLAIVSATLAAGRPRARATVRPAGMVHA